MFLKTYFTYFLLIIPFSLSAQHEVPIDQIVAVVNTNIILKSDVDRNLMEYLSRPGEEFNEELWYDVMESMIDNLVLVEKAKIDSIIVTDEEVNRLMDQRIRALLERAGSEEALERAFGKSIVQLKAEYRDEFRKEYLAEQVREKKRTTIRITRPEVINFFNSIPRDSLPLIPETVELAQIVSIPPPKKDAENRAYKLASSVRDSIIEHGKPFEEMAKRYGEDGTAQNGGLIPLMPISDLVSEYSAAAAALEPGGISQIVKTAFGYHIIKLNRRVGDQIETNHILFRISDTELDDEYSIQMLNSLRDSVLTSGKSFYEMARLYSDDKLTASGGGRLTNPQTGEKRLPVEQLDPGLYRTVLMLDGEGLISEPRPFNTANNQRAFRIIKISKRIPEHKANLDQDYELISQFALQQKQNVELGLWLGSLRNEIHVEYLIQNPYLSNRYN